MNRGFQEAQSDGELLHRHRNGDAHAFAELLQRYRKQVFSYLVRCGVHESTREDLFQEIFLVVHKRSNTYDQTKPLRPWLFTVVINQVRDHFRRVSRDSSSKVVELNLDHAQHSDSSAQAKALAHETALWLQTELTKLPLEQREATLLFGLKGLTHEEISKILGIPVNTVKTHVRRARLQLAKALMHRNARIAHEVGS